MNLPLPRIMRWWGICMKNSVSLLAVKIWRSSQWVSLQLVHDSALFPCSDVDEKKQQLCCGSVALSKFHSHNSFCSAWPSESSSKPQQCHLKHSSSESTWQLPLFSVPAVCTPCRVSVGHQLIPRQIYFFNKSEIHSQQNSEGTGLLWSKASSTRET